eukprot:621278-Prymnesium_polylepis.1
MLLERLLQLRQELERLLNAQLLRRVQDELGLHLLQPILRQAPAEEDVLVELERGEVAGEDAPALLARDGRCGVAAVRRRLVDAHVAAK